MKKTALPFFSCLLVLTLLLGSFGSAMAAIGDDPVVTPVSGDMKFTTEIVPIASLPGITELDGGMLAPAGFPKGEAQFGGAGVHIAGMESGKATVCFAISTIAVNEGWGGKVGLWDGTKWGLLPTTITSPAETPNSNACATITSDGTYAFIQYITNPEKLPKYTACGEMTLAAPFDYSFDDYDGWMSEGIVLSNYFIPLGTSVRYQIIQQDPPNFFETGTSGTGTVTSSGEFVPGLYMAIVTFNPQIEFTYDYYDNLNSFVFRVFLPDCYTDFTYPYDLISD
jgi:hypothetical protein